MRISEREKYERRKRTEVAYLGEIARRKKKNEE